MYKIVLLILFTGFSLLFSADGTSVSDSSGFNSTGDRVVQSIGVTVQNYPGDEARWETMARNLILLREGGIYSSQQLISSLDALAGSRKFKSIQLDSSGDAHSLSLTFNLEPYLILRKISIKGSFPLFKSEVLKAMSISTGSVYDRELLNRQVSLIKDLYYREGFIETKVVITPREYRDKGYVDVTVVIQTGLPITLRAIKIKGNRAFSNAQLKVRMSTWRHRFLSFFSRRFVEKNVAQDVKQLTSFYRKGTVRKRFPECVIKDSVVIDSLQREADVLIVINEGPRYTVEFLAPDMTPLHSEINAINKRLRRQLIIYDKGNRNDLGLRKSIQNMKRFYLNEGYRNTRIRYRDTTFAKRRFTERHIAFIVEEGVRTTVSAITIKGNRAFEIKRIRKQILTRVGKPFVLETLDKDIEAIKSLYRQNGYRRPGVNASLSFNLDSTEVAVDIVIQEGVQTIVSSVRFDGLSVMSEEKAGRVAKVREGSVYKQPLVKSDEIALSTLIAEKGYPYVKVSSDLEMSEDSTRVSLIYRIDEGSRAFIGSIYYFGNFKTKEPVMRREIGIRPGRPFSLRKMLEGQKNLHNLNIFNSVSFKAAGLKERRDTVNLFITVEERKPYFAHLGVGYEYDLLWGEVKAGDHNFLGLNRDVSFGAQVTHVGGYRFDLGLIQSRLFGFRTKNITKIYIEKILENEQTFGVMAYGASMGITRKIGKSLTSNAALVFEQRNQFGDAADIDNEEFESRNLITVKPSLTYDRRDSFTRPRKGTFSTLSVHISKGLTNYLDDFVKCRFEHRRYITPMKKVTLAAVARVGYLEPFGKNKKIPQDQLFFLGGARDVRGFRENRLLFDNEGNPVGGEAALSASLEVRINTVLNFELPLFYDIGRIANNFKIEFTDEFRSSAGLGLRYIAPIGAIGFLYGFKIKQKAGEKPGKFHFSLGYTF